MAVALLARDHDGVLARAQQLDDGQREIGKAVGIGGAALAQERFERAGVRRGRQRPAELAADLDDAVPPLGVRSTRRIAGSPRVGEKPRDGAVGGDHEVLDQRLGAVLPVALEVGELSPSNTARAWMVSRSARPAVPALAQRLGDPILSRRECRQPVHARTRAGAGPSPSSHAATPS